MSADPARKLTEADLIPIEARARAALERATNATPGTAHGGAWEIERGLAPAEYVELAEGQVWAKHDSPDEMVIEYMADDGSAVSLKRLDGTGQRPVILEEKQLRRDWLLLRYTADGPPALAYPGVIGPFDVDLHASELDPVPAGTGGIEADVLFISMARADVLALGADVMSLLKSEQLSAVGQIDAQWTSVQRGTEIVWGPAVGMAPPDCRSVPCSKPAEQLYYVQGCGDGDGYSGYSLLWWWKPDSGGYTTNIDKAGLYTAAQCRAIGHDKRLQFWQREDVRQGIIRSVHSEQLEHGPTPKRPVKCEDL